MTEDTQPDADREVPSEQPTHARKARGDRHSPEAKRLKTVLFAALKRTGLNLTEIAKKCGRENANLLYNLKNGHSETLSIHTYLALARHLNLPITELLGIEDHKHAGMASKQGSLDAKPYADAVHDIVAVSLQAEMFRHAIEHGLAATAALIQRQVDDQPSLNDPEFRFKLIHDVVITMTAMEQINLHAKTLVETIEQITPPYPSPQQP